MLIVGLGSGWLAPNLSHLIESPDFKLNSGQVSWIAALHYVGKVPGSFIAGFLMNRIGRKNVLLLVAYVFVLQWTLLLYGKNVVWIYLSRVITGMSAGMHETIMPLYVAENCSVKMRGVFCAISVTFFSAGIVIAYVFSTFLSYSEQIVVIVLQAILVLFVTFLLKETPQFLLMKNHVVQAKERFLWLQGSVGEQSEMRFVEIEENVKAEREHFSWRVLFQIPENRKSLRVVVLLQTLILATGYTGVNNFVHTSFKEVTNSSSEAHRLTILYGLVQMVCVIVSSINVDKYNRRTCVLLALTVTFCSHTACATIQYLTQTGVHVPHYAWLILACNSVYAAMFMGALMPLFNIIRGELLPLNAKGVGSSLALTCNSLMAFLVAKEFLLVKDTFGSYVNFMMYAIASLVTFVYAYFDLPETRGKTLVRIQHELTEVSPDVKG